MTRVLVVSDDAAVVASVAAGVEGLAAETVAVRAADVESGVSGATACDLLFVDARTEAARELLAELGAGAGSADVPVIALDEYSGPEHWARDLDCGASDVLALPLDSTAMAARARANLRVKQRLDQLKAEAVIDELTGVYNRRFMDGQLAVKLGEARRYHHPFSFVIVDLDKFKEVNDSLGHPFGDAVLRQTAALMRNMIRKEDTLARYGGEEFAFLLPHTERSGVVVLGDRLRQAVQDNVCEMGGKQHRVTISMGAATYPSDDADTMEQLVACADRRLYRAKEAGRNRIVVE